MWNRNAPGPDADPRPDPWNRSEPDPAMMGLVSSVKIWHRIIGITDLLALH
jgi:hypothetical protein